MPAMELALDTPTASHVLLLRRPFAFGGTAAKLLVNDDANLTRLYGPNPTRRVAGGAVDDAALWLWEAPERRKKRWLLNAGFRNDEADELIKSRAHLRANRGAFIAAHAAQVHRIAELCSPGGGGEVEGGRAARDEAAGAAGRGGKGRGRGRGLARARPVQAAAAAAAAAPRHPSCELVGKHVPEHGWACRWDEQIHSALNRTTAYCLKSSSPWLAEREANASVIDFTPNYLCDADAMASIHRVGLGLA